MDHTSTGTNCESKTVKTTAQSSAASVAEATTITNTKLHVSNFGRRQNREMELIRYPPLNMQPKRFEFVFFFRFEIYCFVGGGGSLYF